MPAGRSSTRPGQNDTVYTVGNFGDGYAGPKFTNLTSTGGLARS